MLVLGGGTLFTPVEASLCWMMESSVCPKVSSIPLLPIVNGGIWWLADRLFGIDGKCGEGAGAMGTGWGLWGLKFWFVKVWVGICSGGSISDSWKR